MTEKKVKEALEKRVNEKLTDLGESISPQEKKAAVKFLQNFPSKHAKTALQAAYYVKNKKITQKEASQKFNTHPKTSEYKKMAKLLDIDDYTVPPKERYDDKTVKEIKKEIIDCMGWQKGIEYTINESYTGLVTYSIKKKAWKQLSNAVENNDQQ